MIYVQGHLPACLWNLVLTEFSVVFLNFEEVYWVPQGLIDNEQDLNRYNTKINQVLQLYFFLFFVIMSIIGTLFHYKT